MGESQRLKESNLGSNRKEALDIANQILRTLAYNGAWHSLNDLRRLIGIYNAEEAMMFTKALSFLKEFDFIEYDEVGGRCRIHRDFSFSAFREPYGHLRWT